MKEGVCDHFLDPEAMDIVADGSADKITVANGSDDSKDTRGTTDCSEPSDSSKSSKQDPEKEEEDGHGHAHEQPTKVSLLASSVVCFVIYFVFSVVFSSVIFEPLPSNSDPPFGVPQGVGIILLGISIGSVFFAWGSGCKAIIAGPDLLPIIFVVEAASTIVADIASRSEQEQANGAYGAYGIVEGHYDGHRWLAKSEFTLSFEDQAKIIPTTLVAMMIGNVITGLFFYGLGKMKNTANVIGCIPASVISGFLTCIGYKVIKLAFLITTEYSFKFDYIDKLALDLPHNNDPWVPFTIATIHGIALYSFKRLHLIRTDKLIIAFIAIPLIIFYVVVAITGGEMAYRENGWFITQGDAKFQRTNFWQPVQEAYGAGSNLSWGTIPKCIHIFLMGSVMTVLDNMLKLTSSEKALAVDLDYNHEMRLGGIATMVSALLVGSPVYGQTKFNVINFSICHTVDSYLPTLGLGAICFVVFMSGISGIFINYLPRFLLGGLCVFGGVGFLVENLWEGRKKMTTLSFCIVWIIFLFNFVWEFFLLPTLPASVQPMVPGLLLVFVLGVILSTFEFMFAFMKHAKPPTIRGGNECCSTAVRTEKHENQLAVMAPWFQVFSVESFVFFGTANQLYQQLKEHLNSQKKTKPKAERTKVLIFDMVNLTGIDPTAKNVFIKIHRLLKSEGVQLVWAMPHKHKYYNSFSGWGLFSGTEQYDSLDLALRYVEDALLRRAHEMSERWLIDPRVRELFEQNLLAHVFSISVRPDEKTFSSARLMPWAEKVIVPANTALCAEGDDNLYLLYSGEVLLRSGGAGGLDPRNDDGDYNIDKKTIFAGSFFNLDRLLVAVGSLPGPPSTLGAIATKDSVVLKVSVHKFLTIQQRDGGLAQKLLITLLVQNEKNHPGRVRVTPQIARDQCHACGAVKVESEAAKLLDGNDYRVELTPSQVERFVRVFGLLKNDPDESDISIDKFTKHIAMEAAFLGSVLSHDHFLEIIKKSGIDKDGDGVLTEEEFLEFLRTLFLADLPSEKIPILEGLYERAVEEGKGSAMDEERVTVLFGKLGFDVESDQMKNVIGVIDSDGDGNVSFDEFITGVAMMKRYCLQVRSLNRIFGNYVIEPSTRGSSFKGVKELSADKLQRLFNVSQDEAEEMVFLADQDVYSIENRDVDSTLPKRRIDSTEFQQLVMAWS